MYVLAVGPITLEGDPLPVTRVALVGLGATGAAIGSHLLRRSDCRLVGAVDARQELAGVDLGSVICEAALGIPVVGHVGELSGVDVAVIATTSRLADVAALAMPLLQRSVNVVSICEELAYPWHSHPDLATQLDSVARSSNVTVLGTGANPGMIMDTLPLLLSGLTQHVNRVVIRRQTEMSRYSAILSKFGLGLTPEEFDAASALQTVIGHVGFEQAIAALAIGLGWRLDNIVVDPVRAAFLTEAPRVGEHRTLQSGTVAAVRHAARGEIHDNAVIDLEIVFGFFDHADDIQPGDSLRIEGIEQTIEVSSSAGFESFSSTVAVTSNVAAAVVDARPGLLSMADLAVVDIASKGARDREEVPQ
jgi:hypothetical protein